MQESISGDSLAVDKRLWMCKRPHTLTLSTYADTKKTEARAQTSTETQQRRGRQALFGMIHSALDLR